MRQRTHAKWLGPWRRSSCVAGGCDNGIDPDSLVRKLRILGMRCRRRPCGLADGSELQAQIVPGAGGIDLRFTRDRVTFERAGRCAGRTRTAGSGRGRCSTTFICASAFDPFIAPARSIRSAAEPR